MSNGTEDRIWTRLGFGVFSIAVVALFIRLRFGVDFTDESFYVALAYAPELGNVPIVDEPSIHQFAALLWAPAARAFISLNGSADGLVLFGRHLYFALAVASAIVTVRMLCRMTDCGTAWLISAFVLVYIPFTLPQLSYNTLAGLGLLSGLGFLGTTVGAERPNRDLFLAAFSLAVATIAYAPLVIVTVPAVGLCVGGRLGLDDRKGLFWSRRLTAAVLGGGLALGWFVWQVGTDIDLVSIQRMLAMNEAIGMQGGGGAKLRAITFEILLQSRLLVAYGLILAAAASTFRWVGNPWIGVPLLLLVGPAAGWSSSVYLARTAPHTTLPFMIIALGLASLIWLPGRAELQGNRDGRKTLVVVVSCSMLAALSILWASANGLRNSALGLLPAALLGLTLLTRRRRPDATNPWRNRLMTFAFLTSLLCFATYDLFTHAYRDAPPSVSMARIESGVYRGMRTRAERGDFVSRLESDLAEVRGGARTVLFFDYFPAGYLLTNLQPRTPAIWMFFLKGETRDQHPVRDFYAAAFDEPNLLPDLVVEFRVWMLKDRFDARTAEWDPVRVALARGDYETVRTRDAYEIRRLRSTR